MQAQSDETAPTPADVKELADKAVDQAMSIALTVDTVQQLADLSTRMLARLNGELRAIAAEAGPDAAPSTRHEQLRKLTLSMADLASACGFINSNLEVSAGVLLKTMARLQGALPSPDGSADSAREHSDAAA